jgi:DinB superfamily
MSAIALFREFHQSLPPRAIAFFDTLADEQLRARPQPMVNSVAWLMWHMARVEDAGINRLVADRTQVLDEGSWGEQMHIPIRHHGTGMTSEEVTNLSKQIDLPSLRAYHAAVRARSLEVIETLSPEQLEEPNDLTYLRRVLFDEGILNPQYDWGDRVPYQASKGVLLIHFGVTHNYGHCYEAFTVCSLMGVPFW